MSRISRILFIAAVALSLSGCMTYRYDGRQFDDRAKAEAAQREDLSTIRAAAPFNARSKPLAKNLRFVVPSMSVLLDRGVLPSGTAEARDYVATVLYNDYHALGELIRQRNIFEGTTIEDTAEPGHLTPRPGESAIYFYLPDSKTGAWYYISTHTKRTPLNFDRGAPDKVGKIKFFLDSVEALAAGEPK